MIFGLFHIVWATGWYVGLEPELARQAFEQTWFRAYDLAVAAICLFAIVLALALVRPWGRRLPRRAVGVVAWTGTSLLMLRSVTSVTQVLYSVVNGSFVLRPMHVWELWFYVGAILFGLASWRFWTARPEWSVAA
jgi:hypothetical protein